MIKKYIDLHVNYSFLIFMKVEFSWQFFGKYSNLKFYENPPVGAELFRSDGRTDGRIDRYNEADSHYSQFCKIA